MEQKKEVAYTAAMEKGIDNCIDFLLDDLGASIETALATRARILDAADSLAYQPFKGQIEPTLEHLSQNYRRIIEGHYKIVYLIEGDYIYIVQVFDSRKDPDRIRG